MTFYEFVISVANPSNSNQLRDVNAIRWSRWNIAAHEWKVNNPKVKVVSLIVNSSIEMTIYYRYFSLELTQEDKSL